MRDIESEEYIIWMNRLKLPQNDVLNGIIEHGPISAKDLAAKKLITTPAVHKAVRGIREKWNNDKIAKYTKNRGYEVTLEQAPGIVCEKITRTLSIYPPKNK